VRVDDTLRSYVVALVQATRSHGDLALGASPRGSLALYRGAQARAAVRGRDYVLPDDVQAVFPSLAGHRLRSSDGAGVDLAAILAAVPIP